MIEPGQYVRPIRWSDGTSARLYSLAAIAQQYPAVARYPASIRILLEGAMRKFDGIRVTEQHLSQLLNWGRTLPAEVPFCVSRVLLQDASGIPLLADLAAMRTEAIRQGVPADAIEPEIPVDLVIDHSVIVDAHGSGGALEANSDAEYHRNRERYEFVKWAAQAFDKLRVLPPGTGIVHQVNLEYLATGIVEDREWVFPDTLVGTDSHTTMVNGLGVLGWGVGGLEAESALLGEPLYMESPEVLAVVLDGRLPPGVTATDAALQLTHALRKFGVVGKLIEFIGDGARALSIPDRATIANMAPEYGATSGFFAIDEATLEYLKLTGRPAHAVQRLEAYCREQGLFGFAEPDAVDYSAIFRFDLSSLGRTVAGPSRPQQTLTLSSVPASIPESSATTGLRASRDGGLRDGDIVLAAITSCTNTANPAGMIAAGLFAKAAVQRGLRVAPHVKTVLAPGSQAVTLYLQNAGLLSSLETLGFHVAAYGCAVCVGNSGDLMDGVEQQIVAGELTAAAVLSGNRNFEGRIHRAVKANYLASPLLVVAYALAGTILRDLDSEPIGYDPTGVPVFLHQLCAQDDEIQRMVAEAVNEDVYRQVYAAPMKVPRAWAQIASARGASFAWPEESSYLIEPPFFAAAEQRDRLASIPASRVLAVLGDSITTDHISPVGEILKDSDAGRYLCRHNVLPSDFNTYGARRCNHHVMVRGTFAHPKLRNRLAHPHIGAFSRSARDGTLRSIFEIATENAEDNQPSIIIAGHLYGSGSARDWAAKGTALLGVRAVLAKSFERIHRSNLVLMGILPLEMPEHSEIDTVEWTGSESVGIELDIVDGRPKAFARITVTRGSTIVATLQCKLRIDTQAELRYIHAGGVLPYLSRKRTSVS